MSDPIDPTKTHSVGKIRVPHSPGKEQGKTTRGIPIGTWNVDELAIGKRGFGKSTRLIERMSELDLECGGAYKIGHAPEPSFPEGITDIRFRYYESLSSLDRGLHRFPSDFHVMISDEADTTVEYARDLAKVVKKSTLPWWNKNGIALGRNAVPTIVLIDEMMMLDGAKGSAKGPKTDWFKRLLIRLRHFHLAFLGGIQDSNTVAYVNASLATRLWAFRTSHEWALNSMRAAGVPMAQLSRLPTLGVGEYIEVDV